jgi:DNA-binding transcriptional LysR family regulator
MDLFARMATFVRIVDAGSLSAAARSLRLSLPAVSRQLSALEDELGVRLLVRSTRRMSLTDAGRKWYEGTTRILREVEETRARIESPQSVHGHLVVSSGISLGLELIVPRLPKLAEQYPRLCIELRLEDRLTDLVGDAVDVLVRGGAVPPDSTAFVAQPLWQFPRQLFASPGYLRKRGTPRGPEELVKHDGLRQLGSRGAVPWRLERGEERRDGEPRARIACHAPLALRELAIAGIGIALLPHWLAAAEVRSGRLRRVLPDWETAPVATWAIYRTELRGTAKVRAFIAAMGADAVTTGPRQT